MMASKHGFDPSYVAGVLSRAKATSWLRKQAYKDANPVKRTKKSTGPSWSNYRRRFITSKHINAGTAFYNRHQRSLQRAEVPVWRPMRNTFLALWALRRFMVETLERIERLMH